MTKRTGVLLAIILVALVQFSTAKKLVALHQIEMRAADMVLNFSCNKKDTKKIQALQPKVDSLLRSIYQSFSINSPKSYTNLLNKNHQVIASREFIKLFQKSYEISNNTKGTYSPTDYTYEAYMNSHPLNPISKIDSNQLDTLYKYTIFSGFMSGDSIYGSDTFHLLIMDDFIFKVSFENLLPGYRLEQVINLLNRSNLSTFELRTQEQLFYAKSFLNGRYEFSYTSSLPNEISLRYCQNFGFRKAYFALLKQSNCVRLTASDAVMSCAYGYALCNTKLNNNNQYWKGLLHFETDFK